jgi:myo-inositol-1(or 4)-monophosphatase
LIKTDLSLVLSDACEIARSAGAFLLSEFGALHEMSLKGEIDPVTEADKKVESLIVKRIQKVFPEHGVLAEEGSLIESKGDLTWVVDPIDGTTNFAHGFCMFCVSMALLQDNEPILGVTYAPVLNELFYALKGEGAFLNQKRIHVSDQPNLEKAFLTTGVPYTVRENLDYHISLYKKFIQKSFAVRRAGSACLDLAYVSCGRFDGYWEYGLKPWDAAAGVLLVQEAGGKVSDYQGFPYKVKNSLTIIAANPILFDSMVDLISHD